MFSPMRSPRKVREIMKRRDPGKSKSPSNSAYNKLAKAKTITLKLQIPVRKKTSMVYDNKGTKRLLRLLMNT